ncbi:MAG: BatD family protein [Bacteroidota bacterium]
MKKIIYILTILSFFVTNIDAQSTFATVSVSPKKVYVGQGVKVTIKVYTSTWFTEGVKFEELKIDGAFLVPYQRNTAISTNVKNKKYSGVEFFFLLFPYKNGEIEFPELTVNVVTPPDGGYKGQKRRIKTRSIKINVADIPQEAKEHEWNMTANSISVSEKWNKPLNNLTTGDVIIRSVSVRANGTLPNFIPEFKQDSLDFASVYPDDFTTYENKKTENIYGSRTDKIKYLLTEEGEFTFPEIRFYFFNPRTKKIAFKYLKARKIKVELNKDLAYAQSVQDSLDAFLKSQIQPVEVEEEKEFLILGLKPWQFVLILLVVILFLFRIIKLGAKIYKKQEERKLIRRKSEEYLFKTLENASQKKIKIFYTVFNNWKMSYGVDEFNKLLLNNPELSKQFNILQKRNYMSDESGVSPKEFVAVLKKARVKSGDVLRNEFSLNPK